MPFFYYEAKNQTGKKLTGFLKVKDEREVAWQLKKDHLIPIKIEIKKERTRISGNWQLPFFKSVSLVDKLMFTKHLAVMIKGGISLPKAISILGEQAKSPYFRKVLSQVSLSLKRGVSLHESLEGHPRVFPKIYRSMIEVGENLGNLEEILKLLAVQMKKDHELRSKVKGAMIYPLVVLSATIGIGILMMVVVIPRISKIFSELDLDLPLSTRIVIRTSDFIRNNTLLFIGGIIGSFLLIRFFISSSWGKKIFHWLYLRIPVVKGLVIKINSARFCRNLSSMLKGGVPIVSGLRIISETVGNIYYERAIRRAGEEVKKGISLNSVLKENPEIFPVLVYQMVKVGEETGMSASILKELADFYEQEVDNVTQSLSSIIEPALMIVMGVAVGFFAISMLQPMYSIVDKIG